MGLWVKCKLAFQAPNEEGIIFSREFFFFFFFLAKMFLYNWIKKGSISSEVPFKKDLFSFSTFYYS